MSVVLKLNALVTPHSFASVLHDLLLIIDNFLPILLTRSQAIIIIKYHQNVLLHINRHQQYLPNTSTRASTPHYLQMPKEANPRINIYMYLVY